LAELSNRPKGKRRGLNRVARLLLSYKVVITHRQLAEAILKAGAKRFIGIEKPAE